MARVSCHDSLNKTFCLMIRGRKSILILSFYSCSFRKSFCFSAKSTQIKHNHTSLSFMFHCTCFTLLAKVICWCWEHFILAMKGALQSYTWYWITNWSYMYGLWTFLYFYAKCFRFYTFVLFLTKSGNISTLVKLTVSSLWYFQHYHSCARQEGRIEGKSRKTLGCIQHSLSLSAKAFALANNWGLIHI